MNLEGKISEHVFTCLPILITANLQYGATNRSPYFAIWIIIKPQAFCQSKSIGQLCKIQVRDNQSYYDELLCKSRMLRECLSLRSLFEESKSKIWVELGFFMYLGYHCCCILELKKEEGFLSQYGDFYCNTIYDVYRCIHSTLAI